MSFRLFQSGGAKSKLVIDDSIINEIQGSDKKVYSIVLTGGPSAGKSTILQFVKKYFNKYNSDKTEKSQQILVLTLNEIATYLINQGITFTPLEPPLFQKLVMSTQLSMEKTIYEYAESMSKHYHKVLVLMDRGLLDGKAYLIGDGGLNQQVEDNWNQILDGLKIKDVYQEHLLKYDLIIHIVTAAQGTGFFYTTENNAARTETPEQAKEIDGKTLLVWEHGVDKPIYILDNREGIICRQGKGVQIVKMISKLIQKPYTDIFIQETDTATKKQTTMVGGFDGYLKYKTKYLQLKNKLNIN
jgi:predicted ATPase